MNLLHYFIVIPITILTVNARAADAEGDNDTIPQTEIRLEITHSLDKSSSPGVSRFLGVYLVGENDYAPLQLVPHQNLDEVTTQPFLFGDKKPVLVPQRDRRCGPFRIAAIVREHSLDNAGYSEIAIGLSDTISEDAHELPMNIRFELTKDNLVEPIISLEGEHSRQYSGASIFLRPLENWFGWNSGNLMIKLSEEFTTKGPLVLPGKYEITIRAEGLPVIRKTVQFGSQNKTVAVDTQLYSVRLGFYGSDKEPWLMIGNMYVNVDEFVTIRDTSAIGEVEFMYASENSPILLTAMAIDPSKKLHDRESRQAVFKSMRLGSGDRKFVFHGMKPITVRDIVIRLDPSDHSGHLIEKVSSNGKLSLCLIDRSVVTVKEWQGVFVASEVNISKHDEYYQLELDNLPIADGNYFVGIRDSDRGFDHYPIGEIAIEAGEVARLSIPERVLSSGSIPFSEWVAMCARKSN